MTETKDEDIQKLYDWTCYAHLALIRGIFTSCRSCVMAIYRWSSVFRRGNCSPIHLSIIVMEFYAPRTTSKNSGFGSIYSMDVYE